MNGHSECAWPTSGREKGRGHWEEGLHNFMPARTLADSERNFPACPRLMKINQYPISRALAAGSLINYAPSSVSKGGGCQEFTLGSTHTHTQFWKLNDVW